MASSPLNNPFHLHGYIWKREHFFGRSRETRRVLQMLKKDQSVSIVGGSKTGKTSFLHHVTNPDTFSRYGLLAGEYIFPHINCTDMANLDQTRSFILLREESLRQIGATLSLESEPAKVIIGSNTAFIDLTSLFKELGKSDRKVVICLDDLDVIANNKQLDASFFSSLRSLPNNYNVSFLVTSKIPLHELESSIPRLRGSPFFNIFFEARLEPFNRDASQTMIGKKLTTAGIIFPQEIIECILELGRNEPYWLQLAGYHAFELWLENSRTWQQKHIKMLRQRFNMAME